MIKNYITFINERKIVQIRESYTYDYPIDGNDIGELLVDLTDDGFKFDVSYGFLSNERISDSNLDFDKPLFYDVQYYPSIQIYIDDYAEKSSGKDLTDSLMTIIDYFESDYEVYLWNDGDLLSKDDLNVKDGNLIRDKSYLSIFLVINSEIKKFTQLDIAKYYNLSGYEIIENKIYIDIDIDIDDLGDIVLAKNSHYKKYISDEVDYDYFSGDYRPSIRDLFTQLLTDENANALLKNMLDEYDGDYLKENDIEFEYIKSDSSALNDLENDMSSDILNMYADWEAQDQFSKNIDEVKSSLDTKLHKDFKYTTFKKDYITFYRFEFDNFLIEDYADRSDINNSDVSDLFKEYFYQNINSYDLNPSFSDYGSVDFKEFNVEVTSMLK